MRALAVLLAFFVVLFVLISVLTISAKLRQRHDRRMQRRSRWQLRHYGHRGDTVVTVSLMSPTGRVLDEHIVARIPDTAPDWSERFVLARDQAEERAFHLNAGGNELPPA
jgi:pyridoxamine 5'-phosphate oxidase family protein